MKKVRSTVPNHTYGKSKLLSKCEKNNEFSFLQIIGWAYVPITYIWFVLLEYEYHSIDYIFNL